jgi:hypothetical protein
MTIGNGFFPFSACRVAALCPASRRVGIQGAGRDSKDAAATLPKTEINPRNRKHRGGSVVR